MIENKLRCRRCGKHRPVSEFPRSRQTKSGYYPYCRECSNAYRSERGPQWRRVLRYQVLVHYGGDPPRCACCGQRHVDFLVIDHIHGGGNQERKKLGGRSFMRYLVNAGFPKGYRVLCHNCNHSVGIYGYCPHQGRPNDSFCGEMEQMLK